MINRLMNSNYSVYLKPDNSDSDYTGFGDSCLCKATINKENEAFLKRNAPKNINLNSNIELYKQLSELIVNEQIFEGQNNIANNEDLIAFQQK